MPLFAGGEKVIGFFNETLFSDSLTATLSAIGLGLKSWLWWFNCTNKTVREPVDIFGVYDPNLLRDHSI